MKGRTTTKLSAQLDRQIVESCTLRSLAILEAGLAVDKPIEAAALIKSSLSTEEACRRLRPVMN